MAFASLDSIYQYDPPTFAGPHVKRPSVTRNRGAPAASSAHKNPMAGAPNVVRSAQLEDFDLTQGSNLASSLPTDSLGPYRKPALQRGLTESPRLR